MLRHHPLGGASFREHTLAGASLRSHALGGDVLQTRPFEGAPKQKHPLGPSDMDSLPEEKGCVVENHPAPERNEDAGGREASLLARHNGPLLKDVVRAIRDRTGSHRQNNAFLAAFSRS